MKLSPSVFVCDLLNIASEVRDMDAAGVATLHIDMMDTTFAEKTGFPVDAIAPLRAMTQTPFDIHLMTSVPEQYLPALFPYCKNSFIGVHVEATRNFNWIADKIRLADAHPAIYINSSTSASSLEAVLYTTDMVTVMMFEASRFMDPAPLKHAVYQKITQIKEMCAKIGREDILIQCDGGITFEMAKELQALGVDSIVLGRDSVLGQKESIPICINHLRTYLNR